MLGEGRPKKREGSPRRGEEAKKKKAEKRRILKNSEKFIGGGEARGGRRGDGNLTKIRIFENLKAKFAKFSQIVKRKC